MDQETKQQPISKENLFRCRVFTAYLKLTKKKLHGNYSLGQQLQAHAEEAKSYMKNASHIIELMKNEES